MRALAALAALALAGCASSACDRERLPDDGRATSPEALFRIAQHAGRAGCGDVLHGLLSPRTRAEVPAWKFRAGWDSDEFVLFPRPVPEGYTGPRYTLADVLRGGGFAGSADGEPGLRPGQRLMYVLYERRAADPAVTFQALLVREGDEWRLGLMEQREQGVDWINNAEGVPR